MRVSDEWQRESFPSIEQVLNRWAFGVRRKGLWYRPMGTAPTLLGQKVLNNELVRQSVIFSESNRKGREVRRKNKLEEGLDNG